MTVPRWCGTKIAIGAILGFALGFLAHLVLPRESDTEHHWRVVRNYNTFVLDRSHYRPDATTGLEVTTPPADPSPSLAALVAAGELSHVDLVFPTVPYGRDVVRHWLTFVENHKEIVYITGNPSYVAFEPKGGQPLHLNIWFRDADKGVVQSLMRELEELEPENGTRTR